MSQNRDQTDRREPTDTRTDAEREPTGREDTTRPPREQPSRGEQLVGWFTETMLRAAVAIVGLVLLLVALGQMVGVDTIGLIGDALSTPVVQWGLVAVFALLLIVAAGKKWDFTSRT